MLLKKIRLTHRFAEKLEINTSTSLGGPLEIVCIIPVFIRFVTVNVYGNFYIIYIIYIIFIYFLPTCYLFIYLFVSLFIVKKDAC